MQRYQCRLFKLYERLGSWRKVARELGGKINHATLHRYAHGAVVHDTKHKRILGITKPRPRRVAVHCTDFDSAYTTLTNPDNFDRDFIGALVNKIIADYLLPFE